MATIVDPVERHAFKNAMIQAEIAGSQVFEKKKKRNNETEATYCIHENCGDIR